MSNNEYSELISFLGKKFDRIDEKFESIDKKFEAVDEKFETMRREIGVQFEAMDHKIDLLIEGMIGTNQTISKNKEENDREHARLEKMSLINTADIANLDKRVGRLEQRPGR